MFLGKYLKRKLKEQLNFFSKILDNENLLLINFSILIQKVYNFFNEN
jgi:hypothetical protein